MKTDAQNAGDIHSCSYFCARPGCIRDQRDELRDKLFPTPTDAAPAPQDAPVYQALLDSLSGILDRQEALPLHKRQLTLDDRESIEAAIARLAKLPRAK